MQMRESLRRERFCIVQQQHSACYWCGRASRMTAIHLLSLSPIMRVQGHETLDPHLGASGRGVGDHALQHVGGHNDGLAAPPAALHDARLPEGHLRAARRLNMVLPWRRLTACLV